MPVACGKLCRNDVKCTSSVQNDRETSCVAFFCLDVHEHIPAVDVDFYLHSGRLSLWLAESSERCPIQE